jgi:hypothetical protein
MSGSGFPTNATLFWIFYWITATCFGRMTSSSKSSVQHTKYFRLKMVIRPKHVAVIQQNIQNSVALDGNPEPDLVHATGCKQSTLRCKAMSVTGREDPQGCQKSKISHLLDIRLSRGCEVVKLTLRPRFTPKEDSGIHFCLRLSKPKSLVRLEGLGKLEKKFNELIRPRTRDIPAFSTVPQQITLPSAHAICLHMQFIYLLNYANTTPGRRECTVAYYYV